MDEKHTAWSLNLSAVEVWLRPLTLHRVSASHALPRPAANSIHLVPRPTVRLACVCNICRALQLSSRLAALPAAPVYITFLVSTGFLPAAMLILFRGGLLICRRLRYINQHYSLYGSEVGLWQKYPDVPFFSFERVMRSRIPHQCLFLPSQEKPTCVLAARWCKSDPTTQGGRRNMEQ
jgi:hypothetical protein